MEEKKDELPPWKLKSTRPRCFIVIEADKHVDELLKELMAISSTSTSADRLVLLIAILYLLLLSLLLMRPKHQRRLQRLRLSNRTEREVERMHAALETQVKARKKAIAVDDCEDVVGCFDCVGGSVAKSLGTGEFATWERIAK